MLDYMGTGSAIAAAVKAISASIPTGTPVSDAKQIEIWQAVVQKIYLDLAANAQVAPGLFVAPPLGGPVTGVGGPIT